MYLQENNLLNISGSRIFNADETAVPLNPKKMKVLTNKGNKNVYNTVGNNEKQNLTVLITASASGELAPPLIMFPYKRIPADIFSIMPQGWSYGKSDTGWMFTENFFEYVVNIFDPWLTEKKIDRPVILYVDGHASHVSKPPTQFCIDNKFILILLHPNYSTHIYQPLDVAFFRSFKACYEKQVIKYRIEHETLSVSPVDFGSLLKTVLEQMDLKKILSNSFRICGLHPFCSSAVDYSKILTKSNSVQRSAKEVNMIPNSIVSSNKLILDYIENKIDPPTLINFKTDSESNKWTGEIESTNLFYLWNDLYKSVKADQTSTGNEEKSLIRM